MAHLTYEIYKNSVNKYQFVFRANNGQIILTGRQANTILACRVAINICRSVGWSDYFYERNVAADGRFFCSLLAMSISPPTDHFISLATDQGITVSTDHPFHSELTREGSHRLSGCFSAN